MRNWPSAPKAALIWHDIGNYHAARSWAAFSQSAFSVETVELFGAAGFPEFRAATSMRDGFSKHSLGLPRNSNGMRVRQHLLRKLDALRPDVVFSPGWSMAAGLATVEWCTKNRAACVVMSDTVADAQRRSSAKEALKRRVVGLGHSAFVSGSAAADYLHKLGMPRHKISLGYDVIDNTYFAEGAERASRNDAALRNALGLPDRYIFFCARLIPEKNIPRLLEAYVKHRNQLGTAAVPIIQVGPGPLQGQIEQLVAKLDLGSHFIMRGASDYEAMPKYLALADAVILASISETWGVVVNEAMAAGLPVLVSSRCGCARDLVEDGLNGFVFDPFDANAIAGMLNRFARLSNVERAAMGARSRRIIASWGLDRFVRGFDAAARTALSSARKKPTLLDLLLLKTLIMR